jgi:hypothetical protein
MVATLAPTDAAAGTSFPLPHPLQHSLGVHSYGGHSIYLLYWYKGTNPDAEHSAGSHRRRRSRDLSYIFTCFTGTKVQILTLSTTAAAATDAAADEIYNTYYIAYNIYICIAYIIYILHI